MNVLVTSSRMPFALDEIRKFGRRGHRVFAADSMRSAPGSHSRHVVAHLHVARPQYAPERFVDDVKQLIANYQIDLVLPCFEEVFYLARHLPELAERASIFASPFELLYRLHNKAAFHSLCVELRLATPETIVVSSSADLAAALPNFDGYLARPVWSRGGLEILTDRGPLAGAVHLESCVPTVERPWIVQQYVDGVDVCTFSVARHGRVTAHCTYVHPVEIDHGGGIVFQSVVDPTTLAVVERLVEATGYHGQLGMDFRRRHGDELMAIECNPRPTAGAHLVPAEMLVQAVIGRPPDRPRVLSAGVRRKYSSALVRDMLLHWDHFLADAAYLFAKDTPDVYDEPGDRLPALYQALSYAAVLAYRLRHRVPLRHGTSLMAAYFDGISWNGTNIP